MGYIINHTIVVEGFDEADVIAARGAASAIFAGHNLHGLVTGVYTHAVNGTMTFMVVPDGSKEGWDTSANGDAARDEFVAWLRDARGATDPKYLDWVEIAYPEDGPPSISRYTEKDEEE